MFSHCITALMDLQGNKALTSLPLCSTESDASLSCALRLAFKDHFGRIMIFMKNDHIGYSKSGKCFYSGRMPRMISLKYIQEFCTSVTQTNVNADDSNPEL